jgi:KDO2-lipid IV(A) lauroyltransferase
VALDPVTAGYRSAAAYARSLPRPIVDVSARVLSRAAATVSAERRMLVARHLRRARPELAGSALDRAVDATFDSYARYWVDTFRLPQLTPADVDFHFGVEGFHHIADPVAAGQGVILALPHLGGWEWAGFWLTRVMGLKVSVVVETVEPRSLFDFFADIRRQLGMNIIPLGPSAGSEVLRSLKAGHVVCLLSDRDILGDGVELEFFGEATTLPAGPATLALRTGAPMVPVGCYFDGPHGHRAVLQAPLPAERQGRLRADVARLTGELAVRLEELIRAAPEQWHLQQPNWPSDYDALEAIGKPHPRPAVGPSARPAEAS